MATNPRSTAIAGNVGEEIAKRYLQEKGYQIVTMNYRHGHGEIDIIARDGDVLVFCEVKMRTSEKYGEPEYAVTRRKQMQIRKIAEAYLYHEEIDEQECRFDVVAIQAEREGRRINHILNAF